MKLDRARLTQTRAWEGFEMHVTMHRAKNAMAETLHCAATTYSDAYCFDNLNITGDDGSQISIYLRAGTAKAVADAINASIAAGGVR